MNIVFVSALFASIIHLSPDGTNDMTRAFQDALKSDTTIELQRGTYHFYSEKMPVIHNRISNHDQPKTHPVGVGFENVKNAHISGHDSIFMFHGPSIGIAFCHAENCSVTGVTVDFLRSHNMDAKIVRFEKTDDEGLRTVVAIDKDLFPHVLSNGQLFFENGASNGWTTINSTMLFDGTTHELVEGSGDLPVWDQKKHVVRQYEDGTYSLPFDYSRPKFEMHGQGRTEGGCRGAKVGDILSFRNWGRPHPAVFMDESKDIALVDVSIRASFGMALLAQLTENITFRGTTPLFRDARAQYKNLSIPELRARAKSGVFPSRGRYYSSSADATHFSNCRGRIIMYNSFFEGMMDDAINVHSTSMAITNIMDKLHLRAVFKHRQSVGLPLFAAGDKVQFIKGPVLEDREIGEVAHCRRINQNEIMIELKEPIPDGIAIGDTIEDASWYPEIMFKSNYICHNRARGALFTTPKPILCENNIFDTISGSGVLLAGDAQGWYESGACHDVSIFNNVFRNCLTSKYQFTEGIISIYPEVKYLNWQTENYHSNIRVYHNIFDTFDVPLFYGHSFKNLAWHDNEVKYNHDYTPWGSAPFIYYHAQDVIYR